MASLAVQSSGMLLVVRAFWHLVQFESRFAALVGFFLHHFPKDHETAHLLAAATTGLQSSVPTLSPMLRANSSLLDASFISKASLLLARGGLLPSEFAEGPSVPAVGLCRGAAAQSCTAADEQQPGQAERWAFRSHPFSG